MSPLSDLVHRYPRTTAWVFAISYASVAAYLIEVLR